TWKRNPPSPASSNPKESIHHSKAKETTSISQNVTSEAQKMPNKARSSSCESTSNTLSALLPSSASGFKSFNMTGMYSRQNTSSQDINLPHYQSDGDPFASKLSKEADTIAGIYLLLIDLHVLKLNIHFWEDVFSVHSDSTHLVEFYFAVGVLSTLGNGYVIYMSIQRKRKLKPAEIMTVNLAVCDLGISVTGKPFSVIAFFSHRWIFGWSACRWYGWTGFFFGVGSLITMTAVSLDRYFKICYLAYGIIWSYAAFWATIPFAGLGNYAPEPFGTSCTLDWWLAQGSVAGQAFILNILFFCLVFPTAVIVFSYIKIIAKVKSSSKDVAHYDSRIQNSHDIEIKLTKVVVSVWSAFGKPDSVPIKVSVVPTLLAKSAAMYNPVIYQVINCKSACCQRGALRPLRKKNSLRKGRGVQKWPEIFERHLRCHATDMCRIVSVWSAFGKPDSVPIKVSVVPTLLAKSAAMYNPVIYQVINCKSACCQRGALRPLRKKNSLRKS
ncbi:hypothetical protein E2320_019811, partial [Naja naja]